MLNKSNGKQQLEMVNMLIRALADEVTVQRTQQARNVPVEMEQALYQLRLRKLMISALIGSGRAGTRVNRH